MAKEAPLGLTAALAWLVPATNNSVRANPIDAVERDYSDSWDRFVGGQPVSPLNPREIMGLQWQFDCEADTDCSVDLTIGDLWFFQLV